MPKHAEHSATAMQSPSAQSTRRSQSSSFVLVHISGSGMQPASAGPESATSGASGPESGGPASGGPPSIAPPSSGSVSGRGRQPIAGSQYSSSGHAPGTGSA